MGTARRMTSAASTSSISRSAKAASSACAGERFSAGVRAAPRVPPVTWGTGFGHEIALDDAGAGMAALPGLDEMETERPGFGILPEDAGGDEEKLAHDLWLRILTAAPLRPCPVQKWGFLSIDRIDKI